MSYPLNPGKPPKNKAEGPPLGTTAKSVDQTSECGCWNEALAVFSERAAEARKERRERARKTLSRREGRAKRFKLQRVAARLLQGQGRVGLCRYSVVSKAAGVDVVTSRYGSGERHAHYEGTQTCGSVWLCPCCGARISETRRRELNDLLAWARSQGLRPVMITLTTRHSAGDRLADQLDAMKKAKQRMRQRREWRGFRDRIAGTVTATEVTHGGHGWHTHFHEIILMRADDEDEAVEALQGLGDVWRRCLVGVGLSGGRAAFDVQGAAAAGKYVGKWGAAEELTFKDAKEGRSGGRTPMQLLADAEAGDEHAARLWKEYAAAFHGRRQLVWSPGLKAEAGIDEIDDASAATDEKQDEQEEEARENVDYETWRRVARRDRDRRAELLDRAERVGPEAAVDEMLEGGLEVDEIEELIDAPPSPVPGGLRERLVASVGDHGGGVSKEGRSPSSPESRNAVTASRLRRYVVPDFAFSRRPRIISS